MTFGVAAESAYMQCIKYWQCLKCVKGSEGARLIYLGNRPPCQNSSPLGFDCGYYSNEFDNFSLIFNELHLRINPRLAGFKKQLNKNGLFPTREVAEDFMLNALSIDDLRLLYKGCIDDLSIVKVYCCEV